MAGVVEILVSALTGGAVGALITAYATDRRNARDFALKLAEAYISKFTEIDEVLAALRDKTPGLIDDTKQNAVRSLANWLEVVAYSYLSGAADCGVVGALHLPGIAKQIFSLMQEAEQKGRIEAGTCSCSNFPWLNRLVKGVEPDFDC